MSLVRALVTLPRVVGRRAASQSTEHLEPVKSYRKPGYYDITRLKQKQRRYQEDPNPEYLKGGALPRMTYYMIVVVVPIMTVVTVYQLKDHF